MSNLLLLLVKTIVASMAALLTPVQVRSLLDKAFDTVEEKVKDSKTHWDDVLVLPMITALRKALDVPDDD